ncbi:MAG: serine--tRNA ligase [Candidatus Ranarchaeia archaeon]
MLSIELFRTDPEIIRQSEIKRFKDPNKVDEVIKADQAWLKSKKEEEELRKERNSLSRSIGFEKKQGNENKIKELMSEVETIKQKVAQTEVETRRLLKTRDEIRYQIGNILHQSVPKGETEEFNHIEREVGILREFNFDVIPHADHVINLDLANVEKAAEVSGSRMYYLKGKAVFLNLALIQLALHHLADAGYTPMWTPYLIRGEVIKEAAELSDFREQLYKIENEELFLIATSEQTLAALHRKELLDPDRLPLRYAGFSTCFRREAGSAGKDTKGIFRVHQFEKVEQYVFCKPEESWEIYEEMIKVTEKIYQDLEIPYRIVNIASGEMNDNAAKKYDLEAWFPAQNTYREVVSCSNCTDYQTRKLNIKMGKAGAATKSTPHSLNSTALATERTICAIVENHQQEDGSVTLPKSLHKYLPGFTSIELPK